MQLIDPETVDVLLVTHFHLDHAASLPYFTERTDFKGRVFMTHATKAVLALMLKDYLRLMAMRGKDQESEVLYTEEDLTNCLAKVSIGLDWIGLDWIDLSRRRWQKLQFLV